VRLKSDNLEFVAYKRACWGFKMPKIKTMLDEIKTIENALKLKSVKADLQSYAVGVLIQQQKKYRKIQRQSILNLTQQINREKLDSSTIAYKDCVAKIEELETIDLGFYYTMYMFSQLKGHRHAVKSMIQAILSLDTMGRYLLESRVIKLVVDDLPVQDFMLTKVFQDYEIDVTALKEAACQNRKNTTLISDNINLPSYSSNDSLQKIVESLTLHFDLLSQPCTDENVCEFLSVLAELFAHAKTQDGSKLDTLNAKMLPGEKINMFSTVTFLQNTLNRWLLASLIAADNMSIFDNRLRFIMAVFATANPIHPLQPSIAAPKQYIPKVIAPLPPNATADMYLPFFILARNIERHVKLTSHPAITPYLRIMRDMNERSIADTITNYTSGIHIVSTNGEVPLNPMRMLMTTVLERISEIANLKSYSFSLFNLFHRFSEKEAMKKSAYAAIKRGGTVLSYFNPHHNRFFKPLSPMSDSARAILTSVSIIDVLFKTIENEASPELIEHVIVHFERLKKLNIVGTLNSINDEDSCVCFDNKKLKFNPVYSVFSRSPAAVNPQPIEDKDFPKARVSIV
jgi:hypothetical protein